MCTQAACSRPVPLTPARFCPDQAAGVAGGRPRGSSRIGFRTPPLGAPPASPEPGPNPNKAGRGIPHGLGLDFYHLLGRGPWGSFGSVTDERRLYGRRCIPVTITTPGENKDTPLAQLPPPMVGGASHPGLGFLPLVGEGRRCRGCQRRPSPSSLTQLGLPVLPHLELSLIHI